MARPAPNPPLARLIIDSYDHSSPDPAPLTHAWNRYPHVRSLITRSGHNTHRDVLTGRVTADAVDQAVNYLMHGR